MLKVSEWAEERTSEVTISGWLRITSTKKKLFGRKIKSSTLAGILNTIDNISGDALSCSINQNA